MTKTIRGPIEVETGQRTSMLRALKVMEKNRVLRGPTKSLQNPQRSRPIAEEKLKAASTAAPVLDAIPMESVYNGRKKGGTSSGKVAIAPAAKRRTKRVSRSRRLG